MPQHKHMTLDEKLATSNRAIALSKAGDEEGYDRLMKTIPLPPIHCESNERKSWYRILYKV